MRRLDLVSGSVLFLLALVFFFQARRLTFWGELGPAEGFFPLALSVILGVFSAVILLRALFRTEGDPGSSKIVGPQRGKFFAYLALLFFFGAAFPRIGYSLTLAIFLTVVLRWVEQQPWTTTLFIAILLPVCSHVLFVRLLGISLPEGYLALGLGWR